MRASRGGNFAEKCRLQPRNDTLCPARGLRPPPFFFCRSGRYDRYAALRVIRRQVGVQHEFQDAASPVAQEAAPARDGAHRRRALGLAARGPRGPRRARRGRAPSAREYDRGERCKRASSAREYDRGERLPPGPPLQVRIFCASGLTSFLQGGWRRAMPTAARRGRGRRAGRRPPSRSVSGARRPRRCARACACAATARAPPPRAPSTPRR